MSSAERTKAHLNEEPDQKNSRLKKLESGKKQAEARQELLASIVEAAVDYISAIDVNGYYIFINKD